MELRKFVLKGLCEAVGQMPDFQVRLISAGWHNKGVLSDEDISMIENRIKARHEVNVNDN